MHASYLRSVIQIRIVLHPVLENQQMIKAARRMKDSIRRDFISWGKGSLNKTVKLILKIKLTYWVIGIKSKYKFISMISTFENNNAQTEFKTVLFVK